jgi:hypothetical protein
MQTNPTVNKHLTSYQFAAQLMRDYEDCTYCHAIIYSYMLCKYSWFNSKGKQFYESQEQIAESAPSSYGSVRNSVRWLENKGLVKVAKAKLGFHNNNVYEVIDKYGMYDYLKTGKKHFVFDGYKDDEDGVPF